jgi:hypothetical protein
MRCYDVEPEGSYQLMIFTDENLADVAKLIASGKIGDVWTVEIMEKTQEEIDALPDHAVWGRH